MADNALPPGIARVLVTESEISRRVTRLAEEILASVPADAESVLLLSILSGYVCFVLLNVWKERGERKKMCMMLSLMDVAS